MGQSAESQREIAAYYKSQNRCVRCHKQDAYTLAGRSYCFECAEKDRIYSKMRYARGKERKRERTRELVAERKAAGICYRCGRLPSRPGIGMCAKCAARKSEIRRRNQPDEHLTLQDKKERSYEGFCYHCGEPVRDGLTLSFQPYRVCQKCYENIIKAGELGRTAARALYDFHSFWRGGAPTPRRLYG